jgi:hypothetical protein
VEASSYDYIHFDLVGEGADPRKRSNVQCSPHFALRLAMSRLIAPVARRISRRRPQAPNNAYRSGPALREFQMATIGPCSLAFSSLCGRLLTSSSSQLSVASDPSSKNKNRAVNAAAFVTTFLVFLCRSIWVSNISSSFSYVVSTSQFPSDSANFVHLSHPRQ